MMDMPPAWHRRHGRMAVTCDPAQCAALQPLLTAIEERLQLSCGWPKVDKASCSSRDTPNTGPSHGFQVPFSAPESDAPAAGCPTIGAHLDQHNGNHHRWATALIYLNTLSFEEGGGTIWPCSTRIQPSNTSSEVVRSASRWGQTLHAEGLTNTSDACHIEMHGTEVSISPVASTAAAAGLTEACDLSKPLTTLQDAVWLQPQVGSCAVFYSVTPDGRPDPLAWHGVHLSKCRS